MTIDASSIRKGQHYEVVSPCPVEIMTSWAAPYTGGFTSQLQPGKVFMVAYDASDRPVVSCDPRLEDYESYESELVPVDQQQVIPGKYTGFYFYIFVKDIIEHCQLKPEYSRHQEAADESTSPQRLSELAGDDDPVVRYWVAKNPSTPPQVLVKLAYDSQTGIRGLVALHPSTPGNILKRLADDPDPEIRRLVESISPFRRYGDL